jgi:hypothetical protein
VAIGGGGGNRVIVGCVIRRIVTTEFYHFRLKFCVLLNEYHHRRG